jgi:hypothetical protein
MRTNKGERALGGVRTFGECANLGEGDEAIQHGTPLQPESALRIRFLMC